MVGLLGGGMVKRAKIEQRRELYKRIIRGIND